jgi:energy-coupling factor transporter ATP-binding protein EcfA2
MNKTNPIFSLRNFRSFGDEGANFDLAPITVLTGCNSAGKSSLVKALMLLAKQPTGSTIDTLYAGKRYQPAMYLKAFSSDLRLGGYKNIVNNLCKDGTIELTYRMWSSFLHEEVVCKRIYHEKKGVLSDGELFVFSIEKIDGTCIYKGNIFTYLCGEGPFDTLKGDEHFDAILNNYQRFILSYGYAYSSLIEKRMKRGNIDSHDELLMKINKKKEECLDQLLKNGMSSFEAMEYDEETIQFWYDINHPETVSTFLSLSKDDLTAEQKEEYQKEMFYNCVVNEIVSPWFVQKLSFVDSSTNKISRIYNVEDTDKFSQILCELINHTKAYEYTTGPFVNKWFERFGIGDKLIIVGADEWMGAKIYLENNGVRRLLADEGYGITQLASLLLQIDILKGKYKYDYFEGNEMKVAYHSSFISIEEPEVHLHPKYQSMLADLFVEAYQKYNIHFIIETHSEYLIRKLQVMVADKECNLQSKEVSLNYVEKAENGVSTNRKIEILEDGRLDGSFGKGFFDEAGDLARQLFNLSF